MLVSNLYAIIRKYWNGRWQLPVYRLVKVVLNILYPAYAVISKRKTTDCTSDIVVSLTTFPARMKTVHLVIETLLRQTIMPREIVLWLARSQFEGRELPKQLLKLTKYGLSIRFCEDLRSHKKYFYAMQDYAEDYIVTVDDDTYYPEDLLETLYLAHKQYPDCVIATLTHRIRYGNDGTVLKYEQWEHCATHVLKPEYALLPIGCEGVLYPAGVLHNDVFDKTFFMEACRNADDLWLKAMSLNNGRKVYAVCKEPITFVNIMSTQRISLNKSNNGSGDNDVQLRNIMDKYSETYRERIEE